MELRDLFDKSWNTNEKKRFLKSDTKRSTNNFDPESFRHEGFEDREIYLEKYVPGLAEESRLEQELNNFTPPRVKQINDSPYQALVIRYGILRTLIRQNDYSMEPSALLEAVKAWQEEVLEAFEEGDFSENDDLLHLSKAASEYNNDIDDSELHLVYHYLEARNQGSTWKHEHATWMDFFQRLSSIDRFPKITGTSAHALDTIKQGLWSLQEQAIVYEIVRPEGGDLAGIPEDYVDVIRDWLFYEMADDNYHRMLEELDPFGSKSTLLEARRTFGIDRSNQNLNEKRRENIVETGIFPSDLFREVVEKEELKQIVDEYGLDAHKRRTSEMIEAIIEYFEQSQAGIEDTEPTAELYLECYEDIADGDNDHVPPQLLGAVDEESQSKKLDILFEQATAEIFENIFNISDTKLLGQHASGTVADGEIHQDGRWILWDNKRRTGEFKLGAKTRATIKSYIDTKNQQHEVAGFLIIAPEFSESAESNSKKLEIQTGVDIRLIRAEDFRRLATIWMDRFGTPNRELPISIFKGAGELEIDLVTDSLKAQFS